MNFNDNPEELRGEEQEILDALISRMDRVLQSLDNRMRNYVAEAKNADISVNPDLYLSQILAQQGMKDTAENRKKLLQARDELYHTRLLLHYEDSHGSGIGEVKVGLHSCMHGTDQFVTAWTMPLCRHYILDNASTDYESIVKGKHGEEDHTQYKLLVKNQVTLRFTRVIKALNMFPGIFDDKTLEMMKGKGFMSDKFLDEMIKSVFCKHFLHKVAKCFCRSLHLHFVGYCKASCQAVRPDRNALQTLFYCYSVRYGNGSLEFSSSCACSLK